MTFDGGERVCPECGSPYFQRGPGKTTGYWAGHIIGPVICSRCKYSVGYGILESLPRFAPPTGEARGSRYSPESPAGPGPSRWIERSPGRQLLKPRLFWSSGERIRFGTTANQGSPRISREWWVLALAVILLILMFLAIQALSGSGDGGKSGAGDTSRQQDAIPGLDSSLMPPIAASATAPGSTQAAMFGVSAPPVPRPVLQASESMVQDLVNQFRTSNGLSVLTGNLSLMEVARAHSEDMATRRYSDHQDPDGLGPQARVQRARQPSISPRQATR